MATNTNIRIDLPNNIPPISPNEAGTLLRVSTNNKKL
jgi:hypothetical protein